MSPEFKHAAQILDNHNKWRRGLGPGPMCHPSQLGLAIDTAITALKLAAITSEMQQALMYYRNRSIGGRPVPLDRRKQVDALLDQYAAITGGKS